MMATCGTSDAMLPPPRSPTPNSTQLALTFNALGQPEGDAAVASDLVPIAVPGDRDPSTSPTSDLTHVRPPPKLKANATPLLASSSSDLVSPPQSTLASLASTPRGSFDLNLDPPPIPLLRTRGETVTSDTNQRILLHRQSTTGIMADHGLYPHHQTDGSGPVASSLDVTHENHHHSLLTPVPSQSFASFLCENEPDSGSLNIPMADYATGTSVALPPPPPPPPRTPRSPTPSSHIPISPAASVLLNTAFAFDPASTLLASAIPLPESPAVDSVGRSCSSDSVFARAFGFESNADPAFAPTPELLPVSNTASTPSASHVARSPTLPPLVPISSSAIPSAMSTSSSADHHSSCASTVRPAPPFAANACLEDTPVQSLTPQPRPHDSLCNDTKPQGLVVAALQDQDELTHGVLTKGDDDACCVSSAPVAFPSPPSPATVFGDSIDHTALRNDSAFSGTFLLEAMPMIDTRLLTPSPETLATRRNAPSLSLSSPSTPRPDVMQPDQASAPALGQSIDSAVAVSASASSTSSAASISEKRMQHELGDEQCGTSQANLPLSPSVVSIASSCSSSTRTLKRSKGCDQLSKQFVICEEERDPGVTVMHDAPSSAPIPSIVDALAPLMLPTLVPLSPLEEPLSRPSAPSTVTPTHAAESPNESMPPSSTRSPPRLSIPPPPPTPHSPTASSFTSVPRRRSVPARQEMRASYAASSIYQLQAFLDSISEPPVGDLPASELGQPLDSADLGFKPQGSVTAAMVAVPETRDELVALNRKIDQVADEVVELERVLMTVAEEDSDLEVESEHGPVQDDKPVAGSSGGSAVGHHRQSTVSAGGESSVQLGKKQSLNEVIKGKKRLLRQMSQVSLQAEARLGHPQEDPVPTIRSLSSSLGANCPYPGVDESRWLAYVHQRDVVQGKKQFNVSAAHGIRYLVNRAILPNPDAPVPPNQRLHHQLQCAHAIATFLINEHGVSMTSVGRLLGQSHEFSRMVLKEYVAQLHLGPGVPLDHAVRAFLARVRLPGDQDAMDRIADEVARGWWEQNAMSTRVLPVRTQSPMMGDHGQPHQHAPAPPPRSRSPLHSITAALANLRNRAGSGASTLSTMTYHSSGRGGHHEPITLGLSHWWWTLPVAMALTGALFKLHVEAIAGMIKRGNRQQRKAFVTLIAKDLDRAVPGLAEDPGLANALKAVFDDAVSIPGAVSGDNEFFALYMYFQEMERALQVEYESLFASSLGEGGVIPPRSPTSPLSMSSPSSPTWPSRPAGHYSANRTRDGHNSHTSSPIHSLPRGSTPEPPMLMRCMPSFSSGASTSSRNSSSSTSRIIRGPTRHTSLDPPMSVASMSVAGAGTGPGGHSSSFAPMSPTYAASDLSVADSTSKRSALGRSKDTMVSAWKKMKRKLNPGQQQPQEYLDHQHRRPSQLAMSGHGHARPVTRFPPTAEE